MQSTHIGPWTESEDIAQRGGRCGIPIWNACRLGRNQHGDSRKYVPSSVALTLVSYSLQSRDLIADSVESVAGGHWLDGMVVIPGCDKNMPGTLMALGRLNRPGLMVYGGTIRPGSCGGEVLDIVSAFQSYGRYLQEGQTEAAEKTRYDTVRNTCPGPGACGGVS